MNCKTFEEYEEARKEGNENKEVIDRFVKLKGESSTKSNIRTTYIKSFLLELHHYDIIKKYEKVDEVSE